MASNQDHSVGKSVVEEEDEEYESDNDDVVPLALRRSEASDDEEGDEDVPHRRKHRVGIESDGESDEQGGPPVYEEEIEEEEEEELDGEGEEEEIQEGSNQGRVVVQHVSSELMGGKEREFDEKEGDQEGDLMGNDNEGETAEGKKENEPYAVPTAGAFYMHDDRFRDSGRGRQRRTPGGRRIWESKDERAWVHDRFEEMNLKETSYNEDRRGPKGDFRGRGKAKDRQHGYARNNQSKDNDENNPGNYPQRTVRGRGPRKYERYVKNSNNFTMSHNKQYPKASESVSSTNMGGGASGPRSSSAPSTSQLEPGLPQKQAIASSLNSASPPFYPSGSSSQEALVTVKGDPQSGSLPMSLTTSTSSEKYGSRSNSNVSLRGKAVTDSASMDMLYMDHTFPNSMRPVNVQMQPSGSSVPVSSAQSTPSTVQGRSLPSSGQASYRHSASGNPVTRISSQPPGVSHSHQRSGQSQGHQGHFSAKPSPQPLNQRLGSGSQSLSSSSSSQALSTSNLPDAGEEESSPGSSKSRTSVAGKGKASIQGSGKGSFLYNGAQVIGSSGTSVGHGDQSFAPTPALLPVMQFGGQHHSGLGVPAVGMAFPGYVAQPQAGFGNSEMTWLPVLAGAAGALGGSYPYLAFDGSYYARPSGQTSTAGASSKDGNLTKPSSSWKSPQMPELTNDESGQRQNKPRRYSEMNFGQ